MSLTQLVVTTSLLLIAMVFVAPAGGAAADDADARAKQFVEYYQSTVRPLEIAAAKAFWTANVTGKEEDFKKKQEAEEKLDLCLADPKRFAELKSIRDELHASQGVQAGGRRHARRAARSGTVAAVTGDALLARQIDVLYLTYLAKQVDPELLKKMRARSNAVERAFNVFRPKVGGKELTDNDIRNILRESLDGAERRAAWEGSRQVGPVVVGDLMALVALRNEAARKLGFKNYHVMQLYCGEQDQQQVLKLFDELDKLTREPFHKAKAEIDAALAKRYGIAAADLQAWHYHDPFFQEVPTVLGELPEAVYKPLDPVGVCRDFYSGIGLPIDDVLARSDLYEKPGKNPHAFSIDIDRAGDVRILENVVPGREWLGTTLHELGHAAYSKYIPAAEKGTVPICRNGPEGASHKWGLSPFPQPLPYIVHAEAHPLCTEGVAMMFERFARNVDWLQAFGAKVSDPEQFRRAAAKSQRNRLLVFSRWCQVMFRFEAALYDDPKQDLNKLWWDLVEKYQEIKRPEGRNQPDYAGKYHLIGAPAYYHNYMMGEMFASQVHHALVQTLLPGKKPEGTIYVGNKAAGTFMRERVFDPGLTLKWDELTRHATGEPLNPKAFAEDLRTSD
jgi:peptidyl-dipeptidase A